MTKTRSRSHGAKALTVHVSRLDQALKARGHALKASDLLEVAAFAFGVRDGNVLAAAQKAGSLDLPRPTLGERVHLNDGSALLILRHDGESGPFALAADLLTHVSPTVIAGPSGRLYDLTNLDPVPSGPVIDDARIVPLTIHVASIEHKHGTNQYVSLTRTGLDAEIAGYCRENWDEVAERSDAPDPETATADALTEFYFDHVGEEYLETREEELEVKLGEIRSLIAQAENTGSPATPEAIRKTDPRSREAWKIEVAAGRTDLGYGEWYLRQPAPKGPVHITGTRQFLVDDMILEALRESVPDDHPLRSTIDGLSSRMAENMPYGTTILSLAGPDIPGMIALLNDRLAFHGPDNSDNFGRKIMIRHLVTQMEGDEPPIALTDESGEAMNGDRALFAKLGLAYGDDEDAFNPLTKTEDRFVEEREIHFRIGKICTGYAGLHRGHKYLMPVIEIEHDPEDDRENIENAEYIQTRLVPEITPRITAIGGFVSVEIDAEDNRHLVKLVIPFAAAADCRDMDHWAERLEAVLEGHPETEIRDVQDDSVLTRGPRRPHEVGEPIGFIDDRGRSVRGTVITVHGPNGTPSGAKGAGPGDARRLGVTDIQTLCVRVESVDGRIQSDTKVPVLETEVDRSKWMTRGQAQALKPGQSLISLCDGSGDVEAEDESEGEDSVERSYGVGDWLTVETVENLGAPQGIAVTVTSRNGVINTFDEADDDGKYPFRKPHA